MSLSRRSKGWSDLEFYNMCKGNALKMEAVCFSETLKCNQKDATFSRSIYFYKLLYMFQAVSPPIIRSTKLYIQRQVLSKQYCCYRGWDGIPWSSISSTIAAGSSIGFTIPNAVCTVLCSWWWAEEPPETCRAIYRNNWVAITNKMQLGNGIYYSTVH